MQLDSDLHLDPDPIPIPQKVLELELLARFGNTSPDTMLFIQTAARDTPLGAGVVWCGLVRLSELEDGQPKRHSTNNNRLSTPAFTRSTKLAAVQP